MNPDYFLIAVTGSVLLNVLLFVWWRCARKDAQHWLAAAEAWENDSGTWKDLYHASIETQDKLRAEIIELAKTKS